VLAQVAQIVPTVDSRLVQIVELEKYTVVTLWLNANDVDELATKDETLLVRTAVTLDLCAWAFHAKILRRQFHLTTIRPFHVKVLLFKTLG